MDRVSVVFPHQLFKENPCLRKGVKVILVEEFLYFRQYRFHLQKLVFHRASMRFYEAFLRRSGYDIMYVDAQNMLSDIRTLIPWLREQGVSEMYYVDLSDNWLEKRLRKAARENQIRLTIYDSPMFVNTLADLVEWFEGREKFLLHDFYVFQRKRFHMLLDAEGQPTGGRWSFDMENRLRYPRDLTPPPVEFPAVNEFVAEARRSIGMHYPDNYGSVMSGFVYPTTFTEAERWLEQFLEKRFHGFGSYEDAIVSHEHVLHHSVLSPLLNAGLLTPAEVLTKALEFARTDRVPLNSLEGFVRQVLGWREFVRGVYVWKGSVQRTLNFWGFERKIPETCWNGTTGILPVDVVIRKVLATGYAHHIERLMVLGNFLLLCRFNPNEVYRWFMEMFIDAYDWVMVPNVYGMSQFADGGLMATKPYISSSNYLMKMGDFEDGKWKEIWDALFWCFLSDFRNFFNKNPRLMMLVRTFDKMEPARKARLIATAGKFLSDIQFSNGLSESDQ